MLARCALTLALGVVAALGCSGSTESPSGAGADVDAGADAAAEAGACTSSQACVDAPGYGPSTECLDGACVRFQDCRGDAACPSIAIAGDPPSPAGLRGYADPTIRLSLDGTKVYMAYSWPASVTTSAGPSRSIQAHLAETSDGGAHFSFTRTLFAAVAEETVPGSGAPGVLGVSSSEEISLAPAALDPSDPTKPYWISVREKYFNSVTGNSGVKAATYHFRIGMVQGASPAPLGDLEAAEEIITNKNNAPSFVAAVAPVASRRSVSDILAGTAQADCDLPVSPAILYRAPNLYLVFECYVAADPIGASRIVVLKTAPYQAGAVRPATAWDWTYVGSFGDAKDSASMREGTNMVVQPDLAVSADGTVLFVGTPTTFDATRGQGRFGCDVVEMESLDPPALRRVGGRLVTRAIVRTTDLVPTQFDFGNQSGACGYEPSAAAVGLLQARKTTAPSGVITTTIHATGIHE